MSKTVFLSGGGNWAENMASKTDSQYYRLKPLAMKYLLCPEAPTRNPVKYFRKYGVSLQDYIEAGLLPKAKQYIIDQGDIRVINDLTDDSVKVWEYIHEEWIPPAVDHPDVILIRDYPLKEWVEHFYPFYWNNTQYHYLFPLATNKKNILQSNYSEKRTAFLGYDINDYTKIFGGQWEKQPSFWKYKIQFRRDLYFKLQEKDELFYCTNSLDYDAYIHELNHLQKLIVMQPINYYALSRRVIDCAFAGVVPLLYDPFDNREQLKEYLQLHKFPFECLYSWSTFEELKELVEKDLLSDYNSEVLREWAKEFTYDVRLEGFNRIVEEVNV